MAWENFVKTTITTWASFWSDEEGLTVVEYVVAAGFLVAVIASLFEFMGVKLSDKFAAIIGA